MVPGLISSVLDTWRVHCAVLAPESGLSGGPGWGGALEGAWALSWTRACAANARSRLIMRAGASSSGTKPALMKAAVPVDDRDPRHPRPPLPRRPGLDQPRLPPSTLEDRPRTTDTTCRNTREPMNKLPGVHVERVMCIAGIRQDLGDLVEGPGRQPLDLTSAQYYLNHLQRGRRRQIAQP